MYTEINFSRLQNRFINSDCGIFQRFPAGITAVGAVTAQDRFGTIFRDTNGATNPGSGAVTPETANVPAGSKGAVVLGLSAANDTNLIYHRQRIEHLAMQGLESKQLTFQVKLKRLTSDDLDTQLVATVSAATSPNTFTILTPSRYVPLIKVGSTLDATLGDVSTSDYETFYCTFDVLPDEYTNGIEVGLGLLRDDLDFFTTTGDKIAASQFGLTEGNRRPLWTPASLYFPGMELVMCQRYYEKSYNLNVAPGAATSVGAGTMIFEGTARYSGKQSFKSTKISIPVLAVYDAGGTLNSVSDYAGTNQPISIASTNVGTDGFSRLDDNAGTPSVGRGYRFGWTAESEL